MWTLDYSVIQYWRGSSTLVLIYYALLPVEKFIATDEHI